MQIRSFIPILAAAALPLISACGGDATSPENTLSGRWTYSVTGASGSGISCDISRVSMNLSQSGSTLTGTTSGGLVTCSGGGKSISVDVGSDIIANGHINGNSVQFDIGTEGIHNVGMFSGNSISGTVTIRLDESDTTLLLTGSFSAVR